MKLAELFKTKQVLSFEVFPPKPTDSVETIFSTIKELKGLQPDFISVTYGAGGSANNNKTLDIAAAIKHDYAIESVMHLPGINYSQAEVLPLLDRLQERGIDNILALRGDINPDIRPCDDFHYANELVSFIREHGDFNIIGACYPEGHAESKNIIDDINNLKRKVDAGTDHLITQLFLDNDYFYSFRERAAIAGINIPIEAGIMPVVNKKQIGRMVSLCGINLPPKFVKMMERYENDAMALRDAGIAYAIDQIVDLLAQGVDGIHLYTMNNPYIAGKIHQAISRLLAA
jgi:methylenetetrahydrofolate reductase (NADPH)